ncbi:hypothetical protein SCHPADRAFT_941397 [Schizopora paradoxa]|uniref:Uncharacterized protein n=1 Tax=Schizopora paradoxa TaxID=27342 RepID=A0A0H2RJL9_9AGAM|nr:hypothetical protein SCHPADRAFT_941397 [Schizopora paradoxa]
MANSGIQDIDQWDENTPELRCNTFFVADGETEDRFPLSKKSFVIWLAGIVICDLIIASSISFILMQKDTGLPETLALIANLVRSMVETDCLTGTLRF